MRFVCYGLFAVFSLVGAAPFEVLGTDGANTVRQNTCVSGDSGRVCDDFPFTDPGPGQMVSQVECIDNGGQVQGYRFTWKYKDGLPLAGNVGPWIGGASGGGTLNTYAISKPVVGVFVYQDGGGATGDVSGIGFKYDDNSTQNFCSPNSGHLALYSPLQLNFLGMSCFMRRKNNADPTQGYDRSYECLPYTDTCIGQVFDDPLLTDMTAFVGGANVQQSANIYIEGVIGCGPRTYTISKPASATFSLTHTGNTNFMTGNLLTLQSTLPSEEGIWPITVVVTLVNYPSITMTLNFNAIILCPVTTMDWSTFPTENHTIRLKLDDPYSTSLQFSTLRTPACTAGLVFTLTPSLPFVVFTPNFPLIDNGNIVITGLTKANHGITYPLTLTATQTNPASAIPTTITITKPINLTILDPCASELTQTNPTDLVGVTTVIAQKNTGQSQSFAIETPVQLANPTSGLVCNFVSSMSPVAAYISYDPLTMTYAVDSSKVVLPTDIGPHKFTITIDSLEYPGTVATITKDFIVNIICNPSPITITSQPLDATVFIKDTLKTTPFLFSQAQTCNLPYTITHTFWQNGILMPQPPEIVFDPISQTYTIMMAKRPQRGEWKIKTTVTQIHPFDVPITSSASFVVTVPDDCLKTSLVEPNFSNMTVSIEGPGESQDLFVEDRKSLLENDKTYCGQRFYTLEPAYSFLTLVGDSIILQTSNFEDQGVHNLKITVKLQDFPFASEQTQTIQLIIFCEMMRAQVIQSLPELINHRIMIDPLQTKPFQFANQPGCKSALVLSPNSTFVTVNQNSIEINPTSLSQAGIYNYTLTLVPAFPNIGVNSSFTFAIKLIDECQQAKFIPKQLENLLIVIQQAEFFRPNYISFDQFIYNPLRDYKLDCGEVTYKLVRRGNPEPLPSWIRLNGNNIRVEAQPTRIPVQIEANLILGLRNYKNLLEQAVPFNVTVIDLTPICRTSAPSAYKLGDVALLVKPIFMLPLTFDALDVTPVVEPVISNRADDSASSMIRYSRDTQSFSVYGFDFKSIGSWQLGLRIGFKEYPEYQRNCLNIVSIVQEIGINGSTEEEIRLESGHDFVGRNSSNNKINDTKKLPPPLPFILEVTNRGFVRVGFTRALQLPTFGRNSEFKIDAFWNHNCTNGGQECHEKRALLASTKQEREEARQIVNRGRVWVNNTNHPVVQLEVVPGIMSNHQLMNFTWNCTQVTNWFMDFEVDYEFKDEISFYEFQEAIKITFIGKRYFPAEDGQTFPQDREIVSRLVPQQLDKQSANQLAAAASVLSGIGKSLLIGLLLQWIFLGLDSQRIFAAFRKLQIMVHLVITSVLVPSNTMNFYKGIWYLVCYQFVDLAPRMRQDSGLVDREPFNQNFFGLGYESVYFVLNVNNLWIASACIFAALCYLAMTALCAHRFRQKLHRFMVWNTVLSFIDNTLIIFAVTCLMQYKFMSYDGPSYQLSTILSTVFGAAIGFSLFINLRVMFKLKDSFKLNYLEDKSKFKTIYASLNHHLKSPAILLQPFVSQLRVVLLAANLILLEGWPILQIQFTFALCLATVMYAEWFEVFRERDYRAWQVVNEFFILMVNYHLFLFTPYVDNPKQHNGIGMSAIITLAVAVITNLGYIGYFHGQDAYIKLRFIYFRQERAWQMKRLNKEREDFEEKKRKQEEEYIKKFEIITVNDHTNRTILGDDKDHTIRSMLAQDKDLSILDESDKDLQKNMVLVERNELQAQYDEQVKAAKEVWAEDNFNQVVNFDLSPKSGAVIDAGFESVTTGFHAKKQSRWQPQASKEMLSSQETINAFGMSTNFGFRKPNPQPIAQMAKAQSYLSKVNKQRLAGEISQSQSFNLNQMFYEEEKQPSEEDQPKVFLKAGAKVGVLWKQEPSLREKSLASLEQDDELAHSGRVESNRVKQNRMFPTPEKTRVMFNELWRKSKQ